MQWLTIVGIGEDGLAGLGSAARAAISDAELVFGGARHLELAADAITGEAHTWLSPFSRSVEAVVAAKGRKVCVLASGDPFNHGVGVTLARHVDAAQMQVFPHLSAFSLAAARLGWPLQDIVSLSAHGRPVELIIPHLHPAARILALTSDENGSAELAKLLTEKGFGLSIVTVLEALGGPDERVRSQMAMQFELADIDPLNVCAITVVPLPQAQIVPLTPGLPDDFFDHDGQITKREVRALTLSALAPRRGELLWDIGAGSGSVGIEWMLADPSLRAIAIEANSDRAARIRKNATSLGVPGLRIVEGAAPEALSGLEAPHAIFIGGGGSDPGVLDTALEALRPGGRIVANAVTLEFEALLLARFSTLGGSLNRLSVARADAVGSMTAWRPAMPITQWSWTKP
ncbi:MAG: precorrin-6y C5,15-methyltransferase (decarboxylating) subunit CbiE [Devosia sp.]|jgi:precorrin-6Y C5,15-methyltransferase (decarboxylating)|uniref:precorrin-6y C5,15-methyltransferase (decarboxylating) subunit CbiE n=1 Tax=unclassified Devosia TaxID=196773 RepID=UPI001A0A243C|nr:MULTISPECIES: precorrin-6y C5,15-methyltransferase (decarboxylating) subunit CbiE [unclassified Devosia]MBF0678001.1 precorrin-6y C5,15-methyltransferase (decarboxylating) subunit CbiE [Devosia sp.]WEJ32435.1 precorrin-6y C5,15-methyltransferase (decarboxylating) subunit CbiE [Devosia sp. SD17-2]